MIAYFLEIVLLSGAMAGCGYKSKPYYERSEAKSGVDSQHTQTTPQNSIKSIHSTSLSEDEGD